MFIDIHILSSERSTAMAQHFIDSWLADFNEAAIEYEFPQYSDQPLVVFSSATNLIEKLIETPNESHSIYWNNPKDDIVRSGALFFTIDGAMIVSISVDTNDMSLISKYLQDLARTVTGRFGYITLEAPPPDTCKEFIDYVKESAPPKLINGSILYS